jgi:hypothetical protein
MIVRTIRHNLSGLVGREFLNVFGCKFSTSLMLSLRSSLAFRNLESVRNTQGKLMLRLQVHSGHNIASHLSYTQVNRQLR